MKRVEQQPAFLLHARKYTDSKKIGLFFTLDHGRISAVYRESKKGGKLLPFQALRISWQGASSLKTLISFEENGVSMSMVARPLFCSMYVNELLVRVLDENQSAKALFESYALTLSKLQASGGEPKLQEILLRRFEFNLLKELGAELSFTDVDGNVLVAGSDTYYAYVAERGLVPTVMTQRNAPFLFHVDALLSISKDSWGEASLPLAKKLCRQMLAPYIGDRPLRARELFV